MLALFSLDESVFNPYTIEHFVPIFIAVLITASSIYVAKKYLTERSKVLLGTLLALFPFLCVIGRFTYLVSQGTLDPTDDLPFYLCRFMALILPFIMYKRNRLFLGILYFWILAGTINAIITPDLVFPPGHWEYTLYWVYHLMLIVAMLYGVFVYQLKITWKDYWNAVLATIIFSIFSGVINIMLKANYNYLRAKPDVPSILDHMGPWPWYILGVYALMFFLFFLALLPHIIKRRA